MKWGAVVERTGMPTAPKSRGFRRAALVPPAEKASEFTSQPTSCTVLVNLLGGWGTQAYTIKQGRSSPPTEPCSPSAAWSSWLRSGGSVSDGIGVRAASEGYNEEPPGEGSFPETGERVGRVEGNLIPWSSELRGRRRGYPGGYRGVRAASRPPGREGLRGVKQGLGPRVIPCRL